MRKEGIFIDVWVVSCFNAYGVSHYTNLHTDFDKASADFNEVINDAMKFAVEEIRDFRVSKNLCSLTICDAEDERTVIVCEISKQTIQYGFVCI